LPPHLPEDEDKTRKARYANAIALALIVIILGYEVVAAAYQRQYETEPVRLNRVRGCHNIMQT
jgi:hypothetical protein